jgi:hypothetical protein
MRLNTIPLYSFVLFSMFAHANEGLGPIPIGQSINLIVQSSGKCMDTHSSSLASGAQLVQNDCTKTRSQQWKLVPVGSNQYQIKGASNGLCIDVGGASVSNTALIRQSACTNGPRNQYWTLTQLASGSYEIVGVNSNKCLTDYNFSVTNDSKIVQWTCNGRSAEAWRLVPASTPTPTPTPTPSPKPSPTPSPVPTLHFSTTASWTAPPSPHDPNDPASSLWNFNGYTYFVWIDQNLHPIVDKRKDGILVEQGLIDPNGYKVNANAHGRFSIGIDRNGYIHVIGDMHNYTGASGDGTYPTYQNKQVLYWKSNVAESVSQGFTFVGDRGSTTALNAEGWITACARFFTDNNGELYYTSSIHSVNTAHSGKVGVGLFKYNLKPQTWTTIGGLPDNIDNGAARFTSFFWEVGGWGGGTNWFQNFHPRFTFDALNQMHFTVSVNTNSAIQGANRVVYARSEDGGFTWRKANGSVIPGLPLRAADGTPNEADIVASDVTQESTGYFSPTVDVIADRNGKPGVGVTQIWRTWDGSHDDWYIPVLR